MNFKDTISSIKDKLKNLVSPENATALSDIDKDIDSLMTQHDALSNEKAELQTAYIDVVKNTSFKKPADDNPIGDNEPDIDDIFRDELANILSKRKKE